MYNHLLDAPASRSSFFVFSPRMILLLFHWLLARLLCLQEKYISIYDSASEQGFVPHAF